MTQYKALDEKYCPDCGGIIKIKAEICPKCGVRQNSSSTKNKKTAGLLAVFLGGIGAHKFYLDMPKTGIFYLIFCWTCIPAILGFISGIKILTMSESDFKRKYP